MRQPNRSISPIIALLALAFATGGAGPAMAQATDAPAPAPAEQAAAAPPAAAAEIRPPSIFFSVEEQARIRAAMVEHERLKNVKVTKAAVKANDYLNQIIESKPVQPVETEYAYPQFFLESLVYHTPDDWVVMINRQRISAKFEPTADTELTVLSVDNEKVLFEWKPKRMEHVIESWEKAPNDDVLVDEKYGKVIFTLHPNQTFSSYAMRTLEGKVRPVVLNLRGARPQAAIVRGGMDDGDGEEGEPTPFDRAIENITTEDIKNNVGMKGLQKTYKRMGLE